MQSVSSKTPQLSLIEPQILNWAQAHYRHRRFAKDERIPVRPGLLYLVESGAVRLIGSAETAPAESPAVAGESEEAFLGFVGSGQPFEIVAQSFFSQQAYAHLDGTVVLWFYWQDLENWPPLRVGVLDAFRRQHQRKLLWLSTIGRRRTIDRLMGFLTLLVEEYGESDECGCCLPFPLTHAQIGSAIGSTRVTVTRLMGKLRQTQRIFMKNENLICLPHPPLSDLSEPIGAQ